MVTSIISKLVILVFGTLYPAYASYKAVKSKDVKEYEIDDYISKAKEQSYKQVLDLGSKGVNALMQTALKGGGGLVNQIKKSYSLSDLSNHLAIESNDETDIKITDTRLRKRQSPRKNMTSSMYFSELDIRSEALASAHSTEDISSGYSSGDVLHQPGQPPKLQAREGLVRTGSIGSANKTRPTRVTRSTAVATNKRPATIDEVTSATLPRIKKPVKKKTL